MSIISSGQSGQGNDTRVCPLCGAEYLSWVTKCASCGVALVDMAEAPDPLQLSEDEQVIYELEGWTLDQQAAAAEAMAESGIPHAWSGTDLVVHIDHEDAVDVVLERVEAAGGAVGDDEPGADDAPDVETDGDELVYDLGEWAEDERAALSTRLDEAGIPHRWEDETALVADADDEERIEEALDAVEFPHALPIVDDSEPDADADGTPDAPFELLSSLFLAADRLKGNPLDPDGIADLAAAVESADPEVPPYGIEPTLWRSAVEQANEIADALSEEGEAETPTEVAADQVKEVAEKSTQLRELLRPYV